MNLSALHPKVYSAAGGAAVSSAVTTILVYIETGVLNWNLPAEVISAEATLLAVLFSLVGGYFGPDRPAAA